MDPDGDLSTIGFAGACRQPDGLVGNSPSIEGGQEPLLGLPPGIEEAPVAIARQ